MSGERYGPPSSTVVQIAFAVEDVESAVRSFHEATGAGPFLRHPHVEIAKLDFYDGSRVVPASMDHSIALGQWGEVMVELVRHHAITPAPAAAALTGRGRGLHHVARMADCLDFECDRLREAGSTLLLRGSTGDVDFAFLEMAAGGLLEVYQRDTPILHLYRRVREAAQGWDGADLFMDR
jgi:glyoxalase/bleomycin resistance protein/dioxygenase superfamily protein